MLSLPFLRCGLRIVSDMSIEEVGELISRKLFGGLSFGGKEDYICEEIPAIYIKKQLLGIRIILNGFPGKNGGYILDLVSDFEYPKNTKYEEVDLKKYIAVALGDIEGLEIDKS